MPEPRDDVEEFESDDVDVNHDLFKDEHGFRIAFFLHDSIKKSFSRRNLTRDIKKHGGIVVDNDIGCDTVLVDGKYNAKDSLQNAYNSDNDPRLRKVFVEFAPFVQHCIRQNFFVHRIPALKGMGGTVGRARVPFTEQDDVFLCHYLARVLPEKASGGRLGLDVYKALLDAAAVKSTHAWGARHTAESWKERYKKNRVKFDQWIEDVVKLEGLSRKQFWHQDRRASQKNLRGKHKYRSEEGPSEEDPSEEDYAEYEEEERSQPSRKRPRVEYSLLPPNRRQVVQRSTDKKGKARAEEEEEESEELDQLENHLGQDEITEPGPSRSQRSPEATAVAADHLTHRTQPNTASFFTQETIVASAPSRRSVQSKEASHLPDEATQSSPHVRSSLQMTRRAKQAFSSGHEPLAVLDLASPSESIQSIPVARGAKQTSPSGHESVIDLTSPSGSIGRHSPVIQLSPTRTLVNPSQAQEPRPFTYIRPLKAARRPRAMIEAAPADAPYRNTRSRSRSVEPYTSNPSVRESKKGGTKDKQNAKPALAPVDEIQDDNEQDSEDLEMTDEPLLPAGENLDDEINVEKMLMSDQDEELFTDQNEELFTDRNEELFTDHNEELSSDQNEELLSDQDEELDNVAKVRGESLETDDAQTEQNLRPTQPPRQVVSSLRKHPSEMLKEFKEHSVIWANRSSAAPSHLSSRSIVPVRNTQENTGSIPPPSLSRNVAFTSKVAEPPRTPLKRPRNYSTSSMDQFPVSGTRASALKNKLHQQEKRSPYNPPRGTRAAKFARSRG